MKKRRVLIGIVALIAIVTICYVAINFATLFYDDLAEPVAELTEAEKIVKEKDNNPEAKYYLITDKYISGVLPQTTVANFIESFEKEEVKVYSDETCSKEITTGNIASGMYAKYWVNGRVFEISVLGDINTRVADKNFTKVEENVDNNSEILEESGELVFDNLSEDKENSNNIKFLKGDSNLNEIECTRIIRGYLETENWKITDEAEFKSADVTCNQKLEKEDINSIVHYIVFGEIDSQEYNQIDSPSLKVVKGIKNEDGSFEGEATVQLSQNAENGKKNIYKIYKYGEMPDVNDSTEYTEASDGEEIKLTEAGKYAIVAYTYGELENKSKGEIKVVEVKSGIYKLTLIAGDNIEVVKGSGEYKIGSKVNIEAVVKENMPGYEYSWGLWTSDNIDLVPNQANQNTEIVIPKGDVTLTANGNKKILKYNINYNLNEGKVEQENPEEYTVETPSFTLNNPSKKGYKFLGWTGTDLSEQEKNVIIQSGSTGNREYTANWEKLPPVTYTVEYYKENLIGNNYDLAEKEEDTADIGTIINATIKDYKGFTFNEDESRNVLNGEVVEDGSLVLKVYYKRNTYTLELDKNEHIKEVEGANTYKFEQEVEIDAELKSADGYIYSFEKWESDNTDLLADQTDKKVEFTMPAGDLKLTAIGTKTARTDTEYQIEYYYQENGRYSETATETKIKYGTTDQTATVEEIEKHPSIAGYVFDELNTNNQLSGKITGDGKLVLKVYFKGQFTVKYKPGIHGTFSEQIITNLDYNAEMPDFVGELTHEEGYEFTGWDREVKEKVTISTEYTAQWKTIDYELQYNLNGGDLPNGKTNPTSYTVETRDFTLNNPTKNGYTFKGWTSEDLSNPTEIVTITTGSTGSKTFVANWEIINYTITYDLAGGVLSEGQTNPENYNVETPSFTLNNPSRVGYTFLGWTGTSLPEETVSVTISSGSTGNREYKANFEANDGVKYKVEYYLEKLDGTGYDLTEENYLSGKTDKKVEIEIKSFEGFTLDENNEKNILSGKIAGDESLVLKAYYTRNSYNLTLVKTSDIENVTGAGTYKYGQEVKINATVKEEYGYEITFNGWESNKTELLSNQSNANVQFTMPAGDLSLTAKANRVATIVGYTVEYYYTVNDEYTENPTRTDTSREGLVGSTATIEESDKISTQIGYVYDDDAENVLSAEIKPDGTTVLKVYFKRAIYTLKIKAGNSVTGITLGTENSETEISKQFYYGDEITIDASIETEAGYDISFANWKSSNTGLMADNTTKNLTFTMPAGSLTLTAEANKVALDANYYIEFYYQENGEYPSEPKEGDTVERTGKTGETARIISADKEAVLEGYKYDTTAENVESAKIKADGTTTLKVYFKQQFTVKYKPGEYGIFEETTITSIDYGSEIPAYIGSKYGSNGYIFDSWNLTQPEGIEVPEKVTQNLEFTATWKKMDTPIITHTPTTWTNKNVLVTIEKPEGYEDYDIEYKIGENGTVTKYEEAFEIEENTTIYANLVIGANKGDEVEHSITNIDKVKPEFGETSINTENEDSAIVTIQATDNLSGIVEYGIKKDTDAGYIVYKCVNATTKEIVFDEIYENGKYAIYIKDAAGNNNDKEVEITHIGHYMVARIVSAPSGYESLVGKEYETLEEALADSDEAATNGNVKIEIIHNIQNESNTILKGRDYTINLNNFYVNNSDGEIAITVNGKLTVVDEKSSLTKAGKISSPFGTGIYINQTGEFTLGADDSKTPNITSPVIEGGEYGVQKAIDYTAEKVYDEAKEKYYYPEGVFNFYDGKIIAGDTSLMIQRVNDTPALYDPTVITNSETGNQESTLAIVSGIEAVIGKKRYMLLEEAVEDANRVIGNSDTQVEIKIVRDISKDADHKVLIDNTKNIKLDLNGYVFTTTAVDYVLENYGQLEIYDSSEEKDEETGEITTAGTGKITGSTATTIYNGISKIEDNETGYENIDLGNVVNNGTYYFENRAEGLVSNNSGKRSTEAHSYIEVDLRNKQGIYEFDLISTISSKANYPGYGYVTVKKNSTSPSLNDTVGRKVYTQGVKENEECKFNLIAGDIYYIHFGYNTNYYTVNGVSDCFIINSIKMRKIENVGSLTITSGVYENSKSDNGNSSIIQNEANLYINGGNLNTTTQYTVGINNGKSTGTGYVEVNGGTIYSQNGNCIQNQVFGKVNLSGGKFSKTLPSASGSAGSTYEAILNKGELNVLSEKVSIEGYVGIGTVSGGKTTIENGKVLGGYGGAVVNYDNSNTIIKNGTISSNYSAIAIYNYGNGTINIENAKIERASTGVYNAQNGNSSGTIIIDNIDMTSTDSNGIPTVEYGIVDRYNGRIIVNNGQVFARYKAIQNNGWGYVEINDGTYREYENNYPAVTVGEYGGNASGTLVINGGHIIGKKYGVYVYYKTNLTVQGGFIEATSNDARAIEGNTTGTITIGNNSNEVNTENPKIKSEGYGIINYYGTFKYYDGVFIGKYENNVIYGTIDDIPEGYEIVKEKKDDGYTYVTLGIPTYYVAKIAQTDNPNVEELDSKYYKLEDGYYYFTTLNSAVQVCSKENASTIELLDNAWIYRKIVVDSEQDITIKFNNKCLYAKCSLDIENNGNLKLTNEAAEELVTNITVNKGNIIKNNQDATLEMDSILMSNSSPVGYSSNEADYRKIIQNYGTVNIKASKLDITSWDSYLYAYVISNESTGIINLDNTTITTNAYYAIINYGLDKTDEGDNVVYSMKIKDCTIQKSKDYYTYGLRNLGNGTISIDNSTIIFYNNSIYNDTNGKIIIKGENSHIGNIRNNNANGIIEIYDGLIEWNSYVIENSGKLYVYGGTIKNTGGYGFSINNYVSGNTLISGNNILITATGGDAIKNEGNLTVNSGTIKSTIYCGIWASSASAVTNIATNTECEYPVPYIYGQTSGISNSGTLNIGAQDTIVNYVPIIYGNTTGVYNSGTFNFYDGIINGSNNNSIGGTITKTEDDYIRVIHKGKKVYDDGTEDGYYVDDKREISVLEQVQIARVESSGITYTSLARALENTTDTDIITILTDVSLNADTETVIIPENKNITIDLNGNDILASNSNVFENNGTLNLVDLTSHLDDENNLLEGKIVGGTNLVLTNNGNMIINNVTLGMTSTGTYNTYTRMIDNNGDLTINGGNLYVSSQYSEVIKNLEDSSLVINRGTLYSTNSYDRIVNNLGGNVTVNNGKLNCKNSYSNCIINKNGTVLVNDGEISLDNSNYSNGLANLEEGEITIKGGQIKNGTAVSNQSNGHVLIQDKPIITGNVTNSGSGTIDIKGGEIKAYGSAVSNISSGTININGEELTETTPIKITALNGNDANGIYISAGTINVVGYVEIDSNTKNSSYTERGINADGGTINIGKKNELDNRVKISSSNDAIVNISGALVNYYGGVLTAPNAIYGYITDVSENYEIIKSINDENWEVHIVGELNDAVSVGENYYGSIKSALAENTTGTIIVHKDLVVPKTKEINITAEHDVIIDLNGHSVKLHNNDTSIINEGNLKVTDSTDEVKGKIYGFSPIGMRNSGFFEMEKGLMIITQRGGHKVIYNTGTGSILISGGTLQSRGTTASVYYYCIYSDSTGEVSMTSGNIELYGIWQSGWYTYYVSTSWGIYAENPLTVNLSGGLISSVNSGCVNGIYLQKGGDLCMSGTSRIHTASGGTYYDGYAISCGSGTANITIKDSAFINNNASINSSSTGTLSIEGGEMKNVSVSANCKAEITGGKLVTISGGTDNNGTSELSVYEGANISNGNGCAISGFNTVNIYGSTINGYVQDPYKEFNMTGGNIVGKDFGLRLNSGIVNALITDGTITATAGSGILKNAGTLTLGKDTGGYPSTTIPSITGSSYGVQNNNGTFNFYDGILTGSTYATSGAVTSTPELFKVLYSEDGTTAILGIDATFEQIATVNGIYYDDMASAVDAALKNNGVIEMFKDVTVVQELVIPEGKELIIDLVGHIISGYTEAGNIFTNNGKLTIIDSTNEGTNNSGIISYTGSAIVNNGELVIGQDDETEYSNAPVIKGLTQAIEDNGTLNMFDGKLEILE